MYQTGPDMGKSCIRPKLQTLVLFIFATYQDKLKVCSSCYPVKFYCTRVRSYISKIMKWLQIDYLLGPHACRGHLATPKSQVPELSDLGPMRYAISDFLTSRPSVLASLD